MLPLKIALRYLLSKKSHGAVNVISAISIAGVAVVTAATLVVLSVFNGFSDLAAANFSRIDSDLRISPATGKVMPAADSLATAVAAIDGVEAVCPMLTERGLLEVGDKHVGVVMNGVGDNYSSVVDLDTLMIDGMFLTRLPYAHYGDSIEPMQMAIGVYAHTDLHPGESTTLYAPRRLGRINPANPATAFRSQLLAPTGIYQTDQLEYDNDNIVLPIEAVRRLLDYYDSEATALVVRCTPGADINAVRSDIIAAIGPDFAVDDRARQHADSFRMIAVEKWVTFVMLIFILVIATFNIISTLSLMVIEKRDNMATLRFLGASRSLVRRIFMIDGALITVIGGVIGCIIGLALALAQQWGEFIQLGGDHSKMTITAYPVRVDAADVVIVLALVAAVAVLTALITRIFTRNT